MIRFCAKFHFQISKAKSTTMILQILIGAETVFSLIKGTFHLNMNMNNLQNSQLKETVHFYDSTQNLS